MTTHVTFYAIQADGLFDWAAKLVERAVAQGKGILILAESQEQAEAFDEHLWTYQPDSFIPHAVMNEPNGRAVPAAITVRAWKPEDATILVQLTAGDLEFGLQFSHVIELVNRADEAKLELSRERYRQWKAAAKTADVTVDYKG